MKPDDNRAIVAAVLEKTGVRLDEDDPAFVLVELNRIMLENSANNAVSSVRKVAEQFKEVATAQADDFVYVANETLSKFEEKCKKIQKQLESIPQTPGNTSNVSSAIQQKDKRSINIWVLAAVFLLGLAIGITASIFFLFLNM